ncbi:hypothetical protein J5N97_000836 [Dioscorea zingiberensis]|uniref:Myb/SANT-like domain-containing protein n=1 Tax=Dioscorea zingiberensis TaxID=325984 RepID=A0A9D5BV64_9LILI|nr:hypothetical protein J5N97_000836 [Dioscorea zingiberensis]
MERTKLKVDKSFKRQAVVEAAIVINRSFILSANMDADNVENHMRPIKQHYQDLKKVMDLSGVGWNDKKKMFILKDETFRIFVELLFKDGRFKQIGKDKDLNAIDALQPVLKPI